MSSLLKVLQSELRSLSLEASQRKFPAIKDAADRGVRQLRSIQEKMEEQSIPSDQVIQRTFNIWKNSNDFWKISSEICKTSYQGK